MVNYLTGMRTAFCKAQLIKIGNMLRMEITMIQWIITTLAVGLKIFLFQHLKGNIQRKKYILILDNAPYHVFEHFNPMSGAMTNSVLVTKLREMKIESIACDRREKGEINLEILDNVDFKLPLHPKGPSVMELQRFTLKCMKGNDVEGFYCWIEKHFSQKDWQIIFTPPYLPAFQPIELMWADCKNHVASKFKKGRKWEEIETDFRSRSWGVDCSKLVRHAEDCMDAWIANDTVLSGSLRNLVVNEQFRQRIEALGHAKFISDDDISILNEMDQNCINLRITTFDDGEEPLFE